MPSESDLPRAVLRGLRAALREGSGSADQLSLAFSGGLDSSVISALAREAGSPTALTVGYPNAPDLANASEAARLLDLDWRPLLLDDELLREEAISLLEAFPDLDAIALSYELPLWILLQRAPSGLIVAGQGADELFGGYARYESLDPEKLHEALEHDLEALLRETVPREVAMARRHGKELRLPYCHPLVLGPTRALPPALRMGPRRKELLRRVAAELGLPSAIVERPKKAAQYGSGVMPALRRFAKTEGRSILEALRRPSPSTSGL
ncbi:MAG: asparagine synthase-related protein [Thermoplasmata archaeon]